MVWPCFSPAFMAWWRFAKLTKEKLTAGTNISFPVDILFIKACILTHCGLVTLYGDIDRAANQYGTSVFWYGNGLSSTGVRTEGKKYGNKKLPTWFQLSFCLHFTPTQSIYWSGHSGVAFLLITSWLKWLKHNPHYHKNNKPHDLIQLWCAPIYVHQCVPSHLTPVEAMCLKLGAESNKRCDWSNSQFAWDSSAFRPMKTSLI